MITAELGRSLVSCVRFSIKPKWSVGREPKPWKAVAVLTPKEKSTELLHLLGSVLGQNGAEKMRKYWYSQGEGKLGPPG